VGKAEGLPFDEFMESFEACGVGRNPIDHVDRCNDADRDFRGSRTQLSQPPLSDLLIAIALGDASAADFLPSGQVAKGGDHALELKQIWILLVEYRRQRVRTQPQDAGILLGVHRKAMIAVGYIERAAVLLKSEFQLATFQDSAVMIV
jgi:hypothetical protein